MKGEILRRLEQLELAFSPPGLNRHHLEALEAMSDIELAALEAWIEAGRPEDADAWVDEWIATQPEPEPTARVIARAAPEPPETTEAPPPPSDAPEPVEVTGQPRSYGGERRVVRSGDPPISPPRRTLEDEVEMRLAEATAWRYIMW